MSAPLFLLMWFSCLSKRQLGAASVLPTGLSVTVPPYVCAPSECSAWTANINRKHFGRIHAAVYARILISASTFLSMHFSRTLFYTFLLSFILLLRLKKKTTSIYWFPIYLPSSPSPFHMLNHTNAFKCIYPLSAFAP